ncbi:cytoplasmic polyadenylation element-binding protein 1 isoform X3 [Folsomia candida]|uniref:cytoplasmic polyadenylation element-binding protein 1 isoform X3 n=1 Tax=Folsomia candida TaxID=158441 RepID=UPI000B8F072B|nr:cytoplasmic polyadenylation element-binding protein 1 isoform X3 [Folsomia candida]
MDPATWERTMDLMGQEMVKKQRLGLGLWNRLKTVEPPPQETLREVEEVEEKEDENQHQEDLTTSTTATIEAPEHSTLLPPGFANTSIESIPISSSDNESPIPNFLDTNFISENSLNSILRNAQDNTDGFRQDQSSTPPLLFPGEGAEGPSLSKMNVTWHDPQTAHAAFQDFFTPNTSNSAFNISDDVADQSSKNWDEYGENYYMNGVAQHSEEFPDFFSTSSPHALVRKRNYATEVVDTDFQFLDSSGEASTNDHESPRNWDSPTRETKIGNPLQFNNPSAVVARLTTRECIQLIKGQLMTEMQSPIDSPTSPRHPSSSTSLESPVDRTAKYHREITGFASKFSADAVFTWSGQLPPRIHRNPTYSCKIFLGGVPFDITEMALIHAFKIFGNVKIEWPGKDIAPSQPKGYLYVIFEHEKQVKLLLQNCFLDYSKSVSGDWYFKLTSKRFREKDVQVIPWALSDSNYVKCQAAKIDAKKTIFVGALHGMLNAEGLAKIMNDLFDGVVYAGIDTDRHKYPIGSGRVTFNNMKSYMKAVSAAFVEIKTKFRKKVQVDPYLEDATCSVCKLQQGPYFCREWCCFRYFCRTCYQTQHGSEEFRKHRPLMRNASKPAGTAGSVTSVTFSPLGNRSNYNSNRAFFGNSNRSNNNYAHNNWGSASGNYNGNFNGNYNQQRQLNDYGASRYVLH